MPPIPRTRDNTGTGHHDTRRVICTSRQDRCRWLSSGDGVATLLAQLRNIPRHGTTGLDEGQSRPVCISPYGSDMTFFRPTSPCLCHASAMLCPACVPSFAVRPAPCAGPQTKRDGPGCPKALGAPSPWPFFGRKPPSLRPSDGWGMGQLSASSEYEARKKQPEIHHRRTSILPRYEVLTGVLALFGTIQPHLGLAIAQSFQCHVLAFPGPRCAGWRLRTAGYEQSVKRSRACGSPLRIFRLSASHNLRTASI